MIWEKAVRETVEKHAHIRMNGRVASVATKKRIHQTWHAAFGVLHSNGHKLTHPKNVTDDHLKILMRIWHQQGKSAHTFQTDLYALRIILTRLNKGSIVRELSYYLPEVNRADLVVHSISRKSKSWTEHDIDIESRIKDADIIDPRFGLMLRLALSFGLRRKELLACTPWKAVGGGDGWTVFPNEGKGSRSRLIAIETEQQRKVLDYVLARVGKTEKLCWPGVKNEQAINRYCRLMRKMGFTKLESGVTGHGLRAQYAENAALIAAFIPSTLGGTNAGLNKDDLRVAKMVVSEKLGHSRESVTGAYYGSFGRTKVFAEQDHYRRVVQSGIQYLTENNLIEDADPAVANDCRQFALKLLDCDIAVSLRQVQTLWRMYSNRFGSQWVEITGDGEFERGIEVVATMHLRQSDKDLEPV